MKVRNLIARLKTFDPEALVVRFADMEGFEECDLVMKTAMIRRRPKNEAQNGKGEFVAAELRPKSRERRVSGVAIV
jgi:hypothetical protein